MKLDRNTTGDNKYGLVKMRVVREIKLDPTRDADYAAIISALSTLNVLGVLDKGAPGTESEFFVIRLKDIHAHAALKAYAHDAWVDGQDDEYAREVATLADRAGMRSPWCKRPD